jgi:antirestriction protein ArdC
MSKTLTRASEQERAQRRAADRQFAKQAVERLRTSEGWQRWLTARRHFHRYSLINQCLIAAQNPNATRVAGFRRWLALGYAVKRGEKAIRIWVPMRPSRRQIERWEAEGADPDRRPRTFFRLGPVFDRSQVEPLPPPAKPEPLDPPVREIEGDELAGTLPRLVGLARQIGSEVSFETIRGGALGRYELESRRIVVERAMAANAQVRTLTHELAHALLRAEPQEDDPKLDRAGEELVVESIAYTVCGSIGLDTAGYSIPYLASWSTTTEIEIVERTATLIDRIARRIETAAAEDQPAAEAAAEGRPGYGGDRPLTGSLA